MTPLEILLDALQFYEIEIVSVKGNNVRASRTFEIEVEKLEHVFKLSQNRDEKSYENIVSELNKQGGEAKDIAERMIENAEFVFEKKGQ